MNEVATRSMGTGLMSREDLAKSLNNAAMSMPSAGGDKQFLKMDKNNGEWLFGQEETLVEDDSLWVALPTSLKHGWVAWDTDAGGAPVSEVMVPISRALPAQETLPALPQAKSGKALEYQQQRSVDFLCVSGEDAGTLVEYKQSSVGAMKLFGALTNSLLDQLDRDPEHVWAAGNLTFDKYKHKKYGTIHNPIFKIVEWRGEENVDQLSEDEAAGKAKVVNAKRAAPASEPPADADEEARLKAEYEAEQKAQTQAPEGEQAVPRRRMRR